MIDKQIEKRCLNCDMPIHANYCSYCGQKTNTHRFTFGYFIVNDIIRGVWKYFERGIWFTASRVLKRPDQAAMEYIKGHRVKYYNIFYLSLIFIGFNILVNHWIIQINPDLFTGGDDVSPWFGVSYSKVKYFQLAFVPLWGIAGFIVFKRLKLNLIEHFILSEFTLLGTIILSSLFYTMDLANTIIGLIPKIRDYAAFIFSFLKFASLVLIALWFLFPVRVYYLATRAKYKFMGFTWRIILFYILFYAEVTIFAFLLFIL